MHIHIWAALYFAAVAAASPAVKVSLRSSWTAPPFLAEILETVALENPDAFFSLVDAVTDPDVVPSVHKMTPEAIRQVVLAKARANGHFLLPGTEAIVDLQLGLHAATPKIQAFYHHYSEIDEARKPKCGSWVDWYGRAICDVETLVQLTNLDTIDAEAGLNSRFTRPNVFSFDHIYPSASSQPRPPRTAILYASFASDNFRELHSHLLSVATRHRHHVEYILRHIPEETHTRGEKNYLSGYGVALDLKKMEYSAVDDRVKYTESEKSITTDEESSTDVILDQLPDAVTDSASKLLETDIYELGIQSAQFIANASDPLETLAQLSQNFPKYAYSISRGVKVSPDVEQEITMNQMKAPGGASQMWLNGAILQEQDTNAFGLLKALKKERSIIGDFSTLGLSPPNAVDLLTHPAVAASQTDSGATDGLFDASDRIEGGGLTVWLNDIEKDARYRNWPAAIQTILRPAYPGPLPSVRLNLFNIILAIDLSHPDNIHFLASAVNTLISRGFALRFGIIPIGESEDAIKMARILHYLNEHKNAEAMSSLFQHVAMSRVEIPVEKQLPKVDWKVVREFFEDPSQDGITDFDTVLQNTEHDPLIEKSKAYATRLSIDLVSSPRGHAFLNGKAMEMDENFLRVMQTDVSAQLNYLQEKVYTGQVGGEEDFTNFFYDLPTTLQRRNKYIFPSTSRSLRVVGLYNLLDAAEFPTTSGVYLSSSHSDEIFSTIHVIANLDSPVGLRFVKEALEFVTESKSRITFVHNPVDDDDLVAPEQAPSSWLFSHLISKNILSKQSSAIVLRALGLSENIPEDGSQKPLSPTDYFVAATGGLSVRELDSEKYGQYVAASRQLSRDLNLAPGSNALMINGRIIGPIKDHQFLSADFASLESFELPKRIEPVVSALKDIRPELLEADKASIAHTIATLSSLVAAVQIPDPTEAGMHGITKRTRNRGYEKLDGNFTSFAIGHKETALYQFGVLLDPLSEMAQKWSGLLQWALSIPDVYIQVYLNPSRGTELPLKKFYRNGLMPVLQFTDEGMPRAFTAEFNGLPIDPVYTLAMDVPPSWLVRPREAAYDLDNIQLRSLSPKDQIYGLVAAFELDYLVIDGHARDKRTQAPPRGLQLQLLEGGSKTVDDTQVVANLGYFQFKAKPGIFKLEIRPGRGRKIYDIESAGNEGWESPLVEKAGDSITLTSFEGLTLYPRFQRHAGMETADVLADDLPETESVFSNIVSGFTSLFGGKTAETVTTAVSERQADINIFTVASGLLYERFASIMILSVLRNTNSTVKFWFIENFLSPSFLEFIPHMAKEYNFQYELVTYKWPSWLRAQTEKQRIIWAYKILFLDVLFPMDLKKVIFVDADQIVRADLQELVDLDLHGAPYGYTPMGDDNTDMEGFRFWKTGYWKDFLGGRPYHISALYVVDLVRFRQMAAGDMLRAQYQALSADPGSLANLDQDLPNNLQREVPIFSLPEDWLWCETWCSKDRLHRAKTIDLCQNPLTKEPKLARARAIPEWEEYDFEIAKFAKGLEKQGLLQAGIAAEGADALAGSPVSKSQETPTDQPTSHDEL